MRAYRVWCTWPNVPLGYASASDLMLTGAFDDRLRAERARRELQEDHERKTGTKGIGRFVVREERIPRAYDFNGEPSRVVKIFLGSDQEMTDLSQLPDDDGSDDVP